MLLQCVSVEWGENLNDRIVFSSGRPSELHRDFLSTHMLVYLCLMISYFSWELVSVILYVCLCCRYVESSFSCSQFTEVVCTNGKAVSFSGMRYLKFKCRQNT